MIVQRTLALLLLSSPWLTACDDEKKPAQPAREAAPPAAAEPKKSSAAKEKAADAQKAEAAVQPGEQGLTGAACLAGKWHYDFADDAMETMVKNAPGAEVTREEGELICETTLQGKKGSTTCASAGGKPVVIEVSTNQGGLPLKVLVEMSGEATTQFELVDQQTMALTSDGLGGLKVDVTATVAGKEMPFPMTDEVVAWAGDAGAKNRFECTGDQLRLLPQVDGEVSWQTLTRMK